MRPVLVLSLALCLSVMPAIAKSETIYSLLQFEDLEGWETDDHASALDVFLNSCDYLKGDHWAPICEFAKSGPVAKPFFEMFFRPVLVEDGREMLFTGYFEPELRGSRTRSVQYPYPLYRKPGEANGQWLTRREIEESGVLIGRGLEICWVADPVELFFLQIQGSGRIRLTDGDVLRVGYGGSNGHQYRSVGRELIRRGLFSQHQVSAQVIQNWVRNNPVDGRELLMTNPSYVFFREVNDVPAERGPLGAMNISITTLRSIAVDPDYTPLGAPVWIEKNGRDPINRLMIAQDTGSAIKGAQRADIFYGSGDEAGDSAGRIRDNGRMVMLLPIDMAFDLVPEGEG